MGLSKTIYFEHELTIKSCSDSALCMGLSKTIYFEHELTIKPFSEGAFGMGSRINPLILGQWLSVGRVL